MSGSSATAHSVASRSRRLASRPTVLLVSRSWRQRRARVGVGLVVLLIGIAFIGPLFAPHDPAAFVGVPFADPSSVAPLGTDYLGRDVLSRFLWGGRSLLILVSAATGIGFALGVSIGLAAAYARSALDDVLMRPMDVILAFPAIVLALVAVTMFGPKPWLLVVFVGLAIVPRVARVTRGTSLEIVERDHVHAAEALGEPRWRVLAGEILPNATGPLLVEASLRLTYAVGLIAALGFLGFGRQPPDTDWGTMIGENRQGLVIQPWGVVAPALAIVLLTIGTSLIGDAIARASAGVDQNARA